MINLPDLLDPDQIKKNFSYDYQEDDVQQARNLIQECYTYYQTMKLSNDCHKTKCRVPIDCEQNNAVYNILHYLIDVGSIKENVSNLIVIF